MCRTKKQKSMKKKRNRQKRDLLTILSTATPNLVAISISLAAFSLAAFSLAGLSLSHFSLAAFSLAALLVRKRYAIPPPRTSEKIATRVICIVEYDVVIEDMLFL